MPCSLRSAVARTASSPPLRTPSELEVFSALTHTDLVEFSGSPKRRKLLESTLRAFTSSTTLIHQTGPPRFARSSLPAWTMWSRLGEMPLFLCLSSLLCVLQTLTDAKMTLTSAVMQAFGSMISAVGFVGAVSEPLPDANALAIMSGSTLRGIFIGSHAQFEEMNEHITATNLSVSS